MLDEVEEVTRSDRNSLVSLLPLGVVDLVDDVVLKRVDIDAKLCRWSGQ